MLNKQVFEKTVVNILCLHKRLKESSEKYLQPSMTEKEILKRKSSFPKKRNLGDFNSLFTKPSFEKCMISLCILYSLV